MSRSALLIDGGLQLEVLIDEPAAGAASAPAIVMLPSSQRDSLDFDELARALVGAGWRVLRPQPRGMGGSRASLDGLTLHVLARDVVRVIDRHAAGRAVVAGHAFGHYIARVADLDHPRCVRGVVVMAAAARVLPPGLLAALDAAADPARPDEERLGHLRHAFFAPGNDPRPWLQGWHPALREPYRRAGAHPDKSVWWPAGHAPILDLQAAEDPWRPPATRDELRRVLGERVTVRTVPRASHALVVEQPAAVARAIVDWAASLPP